jgi:uncharacterized protein
LTRHWNSICHNLQSDGEFLPVLLNDESGVAPANDWATGFMRGVDMRRDSWLALMDDDDHAGVLIPIMAFPWGGETAGHAPVHQVANGPPERQ